MVAYRASSQQSEHDDVIEASASTYNQLVQQGYRVSTNPGFQQNQSVGTGSPRCFPDVIVWRPNSQDSNSGTAVIIEEVETADTVTAKEVQQWREYSNLGVDKFLLIVPASRVVDALQLVRQNGISVSEIWYYELRGGQYQFTKYISP